MKRLITSANTYKDSADKNLRYLGALGEALAKLSNATTPDQIHDALSSLGKWFDNVDNIDDAVKAVIDNIEYVSSEYFKESNSAKNVSKVESMIVDYLKGLGYPMTKMDKPPRGYSISYLILPADECYFEDLKTIAAAVANDFDLKPDTGVIGGSWTSYEFKLYGVSFRIGFERDYEFDPSGKESSLQLYFK